MAKVGFQPKLNVDQDGIEDQNLSKPVYEKAHNRMEKHGQLSIEQEVVNDLVYSEDIPSYVKDKEAFRQWQQVQRNPLLNEKRWLEASDNTLYNLGTLKNDLQNQIQHLPIKERERIMTLKKIFYKIQGKASHLRRKAFGVKIGNANMNKDTRLLFPVLETKQQEILELFGQMFTDIEVHEILVKEHKLPVSLQTVSSFRKAYANIIQEKQELYKRQAITDLRLGNKISRLEELCWMYGMFKQKFKESNSRMDGETAMKALDQIKKECEGDLNINVAGEINVIHSVNLHLHKEMLKGLPLRQMVIARVASKLGTSPLQVVGSLSSSYYGKYSGILGDIDDVEYENIEYPSAEQYDFNFIERNSMQIVEAAAKEKATHKAEVRQAKESEDLTGKRAKLLALAQARVTENARKRDEVSAQKIAQA